VRAPRGPSAVGAGAWQDKFQDLDLRSVGGTGAGFRLRRTNRVSLEMFGGTSVNREVYRSAGNRITAEALTGQQTLLKLTDRLSVDERLVVYPNLSQRGEYRVSLDASATSRLISWLGWHFTVSHRFNSNPSAGKQRSDLLLTTGLRLSFGERREFTVDSGLQKLVRP
jgi:putative salt-induced outer membrane protein YdiY